MEILSVMASASTVVSFVLFVGIVGWAWGKGRERAFERAALTPFALPDEAAALTPAPLPEGEERFVGRCATLEHDDE